jgi:hypothetical protein
MSNSQDYTEATVALTQIALALERIAAVAEWHRALEEAEIASNKAQFTREQEVSARLLRRMSHD